MEMISQAMAVIAVLGMLGATIWFLRGRGMVRFGATPLRRRSGRLASIERLPLTAQHSLHLVRVGDKAILVAVSPSGCTALDTMPWQAIREIDPPERGGSAS